MKRLALWALVCVLVGVVRTMSHPASHGEPEDTQGPTWGSHAYARRTRR